MKKQIAYFLIFLFALVGCETVKGVGKDLENTGDNIQESVEKVDQKIEEKTN